MNKFEQMCMVVAALVIGLGFWFVLDTRLGFLFLILFILRWGVYFAHKFIRSLNLKESTNIWISRIMGVVGVASYIGYFFGSDLLKMNMTFGDALARMFVFLVIYWLVSSLVWAFLEADEC